MRHLKQKEYLFTIILTIIVLFITGYELRILQTELTVKRMLTKEINYEAFRKFQINEDVIDKAEVRASDVQFWSL